MKQKHSREIESYLQRSEESIQAARELAKAVYFDFAASRAYYGAFYAAKTGLLSQGLEYKKHSGVIAAVHQMLVKPGILSKELGRNLNLPFELRTIGDYDVTIHIQQHDAERSIQAAGEFLHAIRQYIE